VTERLDPRIPAIGDQPLEALPGGAPA